MNSQVYFPGAERQFQHAERVPIPHFAIWGSEAEQTVAAPARPDDDFAMPCSGSAFPLDPAPRTAHRKCSCPAELNRREQRIGLAIAVSAHDAARAI